MSSVNEFVGLLNLDSTTENEKLFNSVTNKFQNAIVLSLLSADYTRLLSFFLDDSGSYKVDELFQSYPEEDGDWIQLFNFSKFVVTDEVVVALTDKYWTNGIAIAYLKGSNEVILDNRFGLEGFVTLPDDKCKDIFNSIIEDTINDYSKVVVFGTDNLK